MASVVTLDDRDAAQSALTSAATRAGSAYQRVSGLRETARKEEQVLAEQAHVLADVMARKRSVRLAIAQARRIIDRVSLEQRVTLHTREDIQAARALKERKAAEFLAPQKQTTLPQRMWEAWLRVLNGTLGRDDGALEEPADTPQRVLRDLAALRKADDALTNLPALEQEHAALLSEYGTLDRDYEKELSLVARRTASVEAAQRTAAALQGEVIRFQEQFARIQAVALRQNGPLPQDGPRPLRSSPLQWPARGAIEAGFHDPAYFKLFGMPHEGIDIAVNQGTPVRAAADAVVLLVRDGGATGYTYVLLAHRDGIATVYGHLSSVAVKAGQQVVAGEVIGRSGGRPGTPGAGPFTSGPHLHFEVLAWGKHIDPKSALP